MNASSDAPGRGLDTAAGTVIALTPDWRRPLSWLPALSVYMTAASPEAGTCLCLDARSPEVGPDVVRSMVGQAVEYVAEGRPFAEVLLIEDPIDLTPPVEQIASAAELIERLRLDPKPLDAAAATVVAHARWVKTLVDALQAEIDRAGLVAAPRPRHGSSLVTVRIPTFGSADLLIQRAIPSVLAGHYENVEILVCSDGPQPHVRDAIATIADRRVRYFELDERPAYPSRRIPFWQTAGTHAANRLLDEASGDFIAPLDHDDAFTVDHVSQLLAGLDQTGADFVYGRALTELESGAWALMGSRAMTRGEVAHAAVLYSRRFAHLRYDPDAWLFEEAADWNLWRRMVAAEARIAHVPATVIVHFRERSSIAGRRDDPSRVVAATADDVLRTLARRLLEVASAARGSLSVGEGATPASGPRIRASAGERRRLAILDTDLPLRASGFRYHEFSEMLAQAPDTVFFSANRTGEAWPRPIYPLEEFAELAPELGVTDAYSVFLNFTVSLLGLQGHPGADSCGGIPPDFGVAPALREHGIRLHATLYPGGGLVTNTDPELLRAVADSCGAVFTNAAEVVAAVPQALRVAVPMATDFYSFRERERHEMFNIVFAAVNRPRKGLDTALAALEHLSGRFHLHVVGPRESHLRGVAEGRVTAHGFLGPTELRGTYWACDAFVSPVRVTGADGRPGEVGLVDGFPTTTACEALASGCALVSSNPRSERWLVRPEEHFLEFPVGDHRALAAALRRLEGDRDLRDAIAHRGAERIREAMNVRRVVGVKLRAIQLTPAG